MEWWTESKSLHFILIKRFLSEVLKIRSHLVDEEALILCYCSRFYQSSTKHNAFPAWQGDKLKGRPFSFVLIWSQEKEARRYKLYFGHNIQCVSVIANYRPGSLRPGCLHQSPWRLGSYWPARVMSLFCYCLPHSYPQKTLEPDLGLHLFKLWKETT